MFLRSRLQAFTIKNIPISCCFSSVPETVSSSIRKGMKRSVKDEFKTMKMEKNNLINNDTKLENNNIEMNMETLHVEDLKSPKISFLPSMQSFSTDFSSFAPKIIVIGVGGAGGNAVNNMIARDLMNVEFLVCNTDAQHLSTTLTTNRIQLGQSITSGLGCGANPDTGKSAAEASKDEILERISHANMVFITAGMGGGTGTGAAAVIAKTALDAGILTVAVVTKPFRFEGNHRMSLAERGLNELKQYVDTLLLIPNQNLFKVATEETSLIDAFRMVDNVLLEGVKNVTDLMLMPGLINLDFADVRSVMTGMGKATMGCGEAEGEDRAIKAAEAALRNPLIGDISVKTAKGMLVNVTGGPGMTLFDVDAAAERVTKEVEDPTANIIFGSTYDNSMEGKIRVSIVATGIQDLNGKD